MEQWYQPPTAEVQPETETIKKQIKKAANRCGVVMILLLLALYLSSFLFGLFGWRLWQILPEQFTGLFSFLDIANLLLNLLFYVVVIPLLLLYCNRKSGTRLAEYLRFPNMPAKAVWKLVLMGFGVVWAASESSGRAYQGINTLLQMLFGIEMNAPSVTVDCNPVSIVLLILSTAILAPVFEELLMRCGMVGTLRSFGGVFAAIATGILFGFMHTSFQQIFFAAMMGIYAGFVVYRTRSVWPAILLHFMVNTISALQVIALSFSETDPALLMDFEYVAGLEPQMWLGELLPFAVVSLLAILFLVLGIVGLVSFIKEVIRNPREFTLPEERQNSPLRTRDKCKIFFSAPAIIAFLAFSLSLSFINAFLA